MEFFDEESRPRFLLHSRSPPKPTPQSETLENLHKPTLFISLSLSALLLTLSLFYFHSDPLRSIFIWFSISLLFGPFAPPSLTAGDIRVGLGPPLPPPQQTPDPDPLKRSRNSKVFKLRKPDKPDHESGSIRSVFVDEPPPPKKTERRVITVKEEQEQEEQQTPDPDPSKRSRNSKVFKLRKPDHESGSIRSVFVDEPPPPKIERKVITVKEEQVQEQEKQEYEQEEEEEQDWSVGDLELLKKQMVKNPVGMPGRWEAVAGAFCGRHKVESVVKMAKSMGEKKLSDSDSFSRFLKDRKAVDKRVDEVIENERQNVGGGGGSWSSGEDIALLNALKAFPKDVAMRWEKITAAVPGRSKAACMKRVADLKKDFRSSKGANQA